MPKLHTLETLHNAAPAILPSLLLCDFAHLHREIAKLEEAGVAALHLDVMDGVFVPNFTYGMTIVSALSGITDRVLDVHLMMVHPEKYVQAFVDAGADVLTIHAEATEHPIPVLQQIRKAGCAAGIAINPQTPVSAIEDVIEHADLALVMSVHAGFGGQSFDSSVLSKFQAIRSCNGGENILLEIDGGINAATVGAATEHGAQLLVAGSAIFNESDYSKAIGTMVSNIQYLK